MLYAPGLLPAPVAWSPPATPPAQAREAQHSCGSFVSYRLLSLCLASNLFPSVHLPSHLRSFILDHTLHPLDFPHQLPWTTGSVSCGALKRLLEASCIRPHPLQLLPREPSHQEPHSMFLWPPNLCSGFLLLLKSIAPLAS